MFGRKKVELSQESIDALVTLDNDIQAVREMLLDVLDASHSIMQRLVEEIRNGNGDDHEEVGVEVFAPEAELITPLPTKQYPVTREYPETSADDENRVRNSPFTRAPRSTQAKWLAEEVLADREWHNAYVIAGDYANDERHLRYLKHAIAGRLREMHEDGLLDRRKAKGGRNLYEYRLRQKK